MSETNKQKPNTGAAGHNERLVMRLKALLPGLEYSRETHVQWRDCDQRYRDENPSIGDAEFHQTCVDEYDERIRTINDAAEYITTYDA